MAATHDTRNTELVDAFEAFYRTYYDEAIKQLAQHYPQEQRSLEIDWFDLYRFDEDLADDYLAEPEQVREYAEEALRVYDLPIDVDLGRAHVRVHNLGEDMEHYPGEFSPTRHARRYRTLRGNVLVTTDPYSKIQEAAFECQRCGSITHIPQSGGDWQEPHECQGCERQGPFQVDVERSELVDGQTIQIQTPPEVATGAGNTMQVFVEDDLCGDVQMGDTISVSGVVRLNQKTNGNQKTGEFVPYLEGEHIHVDDAQRADIDVDADLRERIEAIADGAEGDPLTVAAESFHPKVHGYEDQKKALVLAIVGGATNTPGIRGKFHVLFIGDPSTGKSELINRVNDVAARSLAVSGQQSTSAGLLSTATQGEFSDGRWTLSPGAFVKANEGVVTIDELDDMAPENRAAMLEPMANQQVNVSKAGINATLSTKTAVCAAANPKYSSFDRYEPLDEQFGFESNLISRFDLVFTFQDQQDKDHDRDIADHTTKYRDAKIRQGRGEAIPDDQQGVVDKPVDDETLRTWLALANQQPDPVYESEAVRKQLRDSFVSLRGANGYGEDDEVPVTFRKLPGVERVARAHAKLEFSPVVTERHAQQAMALVGTSMQDYQTTEDGTLDAAKAETGKSSTQHGITKSLEQSMRDLIETDDYTRSIPREDVFAHAREEYDVDADDRRLHDELDTFYDNGVIVEPEQDEVRWIGRA